LPAAAWALWWEDFMLREKALRTLQQMVNSVDWQQILSDRLPYEISPFDAVRMPATSPTH
jgi:hypothetical protein